MRKQLKGFTDFVRQHGIVGLAIGLAIGAQVTRVVQTIVEKLVNPLIGYIVGDTRDLEKLTWTITTGPRSMTIGWGAVLSALITLLAISAVIYLIVHGLKLDRVDKKKN